MVKPVISDPGRVDDVDGLDFDKESHGMQFEHEEKVEHPHSHMRLLEEEKKQAENPPE